MTTTPTRPPRKTTTTTWIAAILLLIVVIIGGVWALNEWHKRTAYNQAIGLFNDQKYSEAASQLEPLLPKLSGTMEHDGRETLAECYANLGRNPRQSNAQNMVYLRKAYKLDPDKLMQSERTMLEKLKDQ